MKGLPDSVIVGTITNAKRRAVKRNIAARRAAGRHKHDDLTLRDYVGGTILLVGVILIGTILLAL